MHSTSPFQVAWRSFPMLKKERPEPLWAQLVVGAALALPIGVSLMLLNGLVTDRATDPGWWRASLLFNVYTCLFVAYSMLAIRRGIEKLLPAASIDAISAGGDWRGTLVVNIIAIAGIVLGISISFTVTSWVINWNPWVAFRSNGIAKTEFVAFVLVVATANRFWWHRRLKQDRLLHQATEARLRLLQPASRQPNAAGKPRLSKPGPPIALAHSCRQPGPSHHHQVHSAPQP